MNTWNIIIKQNTEDTFDKNIPSGEKKLKISTDQLGNGDSMVSTNVFAELRKSKFDLEANTTDLLKLSLAVYTVDQVVSRESYGYQGWSRHFKMYFPVTNIKDWDNCQSDLENLLSFLSGDKWEIVFRQKIEKQEKLDISSKANPDKTQTISLFSGGMDSFIGAIDLLERKVKVKFVSHYKRGSESSVQSKLYAELEKKYGSKAFSFHQFYVQPNQRHSDASKERSSRARSFLFLCLGICVANSLGSKVGLIIPENGLISLNVPLTGTRLSSHSTRTTHPFYFSLFKNITSKLGIKNILSNPYQFKTKGEMMVDCLNPKLLKKLGKETLSCSHSEHSRYAGLSPGVQCGYCVPCIIRQAAEKKSKIGGTNYVHSINTSPPVQSTQSGSDIRAFKLAIERLKDKSNQSIIFDILSSGPIPFDSKTYLDKYIDTYKRGMKEVQDFLV